MHQNQFDMIIIGGGAAGMMAALAAAEQGAHVMLLERNAALGRKLAITGKGRCNLTNACTPNEVLQNIPRGNRFLHSAMSRFSPEDAMAFFTGLGVPLKTERGNRVFPQSDRASDVVAALRNALYTNGVSIVQARATALLQQGGQITGVQTEQGERFFCRAVILATGGLSYPRTGSTGDGYRMAEAVGHTIVPPRPSLSPLETKDDFCSRMQGLALKNVGLRVINTQGKQIYQDFGELLFTHFGVSGPIVLSASAHMDALETESYTLVLDLKPALDEKTLDARLVRELNTHANRAFHNILPSLLPRLLVPVMIERCGIPGETKGNCITKAQRQTLLHLLKSFELSVKRPRPIAEAIVTSGGVELSEINPSTMESKRISGLYFAGEVLNADAYTGGFNLQIAWATGRAAGLHAALASSQRSEFDESSN